MKQTEIAITNLYQFNVCYETLNSKSRKSEQKKTTKTNETNVISMRMCRQGVGLLTV